MIPKYLVNSDVIQNGNNLKEGDIIYKCIYSTYGVCTNDEIACTFSSNGDYPFFGVDKKYLTECK